MMTRKELCEKLHDVADQLTAFGRDWRTTATRVSRATDYCDAIGYIGDLRQDIVAVFTNLEEVVGSLQGDEDEDEDEAILV